MKRRNSGRRIIVLTLLLWAGTFIASFHFHNLFDNNSFSLLPASPQILNEESEFNHHFTRISQGEKDEATHFPKELTMTLLNWKRKDWLQTIIYRAQDYRDFITEIIIGNNNPDVIITADDFDSPHVKLRVLNFPQNRFFFARYELCLMGTGKYCYFQDDDWENRHLRSLYANFLRFPHLLHTDTNAFVHYLSWTWTFFESNVNMHAGFSWLGTGGIASKENVRRFVEVQVPLLPRESVNLADMYFSTWFNQVPYQLENELVELTSKDGFSAGSSGIKRNKFHINEGARMLYKELLVNSSKFTKEEEHPTRDERYTKSPCHLDDCLFTTSLRTFPSPTKIVYEPRWDLETSEIVHSNLFDYTFFVNNPYHYAVDEKIETSWISLSGMQTGEFFGLDMLQPGYYRNIYVEVGHQFQRDLVIEASLDGISWNNQSWCSWNLVSRSSHNIEQGSFHYKLASPCSCPLRFIRFRALQAFSTPLQVFDIYYTDKFSKWNNSDSVSQEKIQKCKQATSRVNLPVSHIQHIKEIGKGEIPVSLVMLHLEKLDNVKTILASVAQHKFINEYIIWNNNVDFHLTKELLFPDGNFPEHVKLRIVNSPQNVYDFAKYTACTMATNDYCYLQDANWLNVYIRSQYSQFLRFPEVFHSITSSRAHFAHQKWSVYNKEKGLHAGFALHGVGSFISKDRANHFLYQLSQIQIKHTEMLQADIFFSYFSNNYPWELSAVARPLSQGGETELTTPMSTQTPSSSFYPVLTNSANIVFGLLANESLKVIPTVAPYPPFNLRYIRAPCADDKCLFATNLYSFVDPESVSFIGHSIKEQEDFYNGLGWPSTTFWVENSYDRAVDGDLFTCWTSYTDAKEGDYFGLDLLKHEIHSVFGVVLDNDIAKFGVKVSTDEIIWEASEYTVTQARMLAGAVRLYSITLEYAKPFRFIKFEASQELANLQIPLSVYEVFEGGDKTAQATFGANKILDPSFEESTIEREDNNKDNNNNNNNNNERSNDWFIQTGQNEPNLGSNVENRRTIVSHTGTSSLRFTAEDATVKNSASQVVHLHQSTPKGVVVSAASKAEGVGSSTDIHTSDGYALVVDLTLSDGTSKWNAYVSVFNGGTHGWQFRTIYVDTTISIKSVTVHLFFNNRKGTVYFDDVSLQEEA